MIFLLKQTSKDAFGTQSPHQCCTIAISLAKEMSPNSAINISPRNFRRTPFSQVVHIFFFSFIYCFNILAERYAQYVRLNPEAAEGAVPTEVGAQASNEPVIDSQVFRNADQNTNATAGTSQDHAHHEQVQYRRLRPPTEDVIDWVFLLHFFCT
jgi:hypothetical protein